MVRRALEFLQLYWYKEMLTKRVILKIKLIILAAEAMSNNYYISTKDIFFKKKLG